MKQHHHLFLTAILLCSFFAGEVSGQSQNQKSRVYQPSSEDYFKPGDWVYYPFKETPRYGVEVFPLVASKDFNHFWNDPALHPADGRKGVFSTNRWWNRQAGLALTAVLSPEFHWRNGSRGWFQVRVAMERQAFQLNENYNYFIGKQPPLTSNGPIEWLPLQTSEGISLERSQAAVTLELMTLRQGLLSFHAGAGVCWQHTAMRVRKDVSYLPWAVKIRFEDAFQNGLHLKPVGVLGASVGSKVYVTADFRFYPLSVKPSEQYQLYYSQPGVVAPVKVSASPDGKWGYSVSLGVGVRW